MRLSPCGTGCLKNVFLLLLDFHPHAPEVVGVAIEVTFHGSGMMAVMDKMGSIKSSGTVTSVSTEPLSDQIFAVPAGFKVKEK